MEVHQGDIYLGLGTDVRRRDNTSSYTQRLHREAGTILRLRRQDWSVCGDGFVDPLGQEQCDGGPANDDELPDACRSSCTLPRCGDMVVDQGEQCDGGPDCTSQCTLVPPAPKDMGVTERDMGATDLGAPVPDMAGAPPAEMGADTGQRPRAPDQGHAPKPEAPGQDEQPSSQEDSGCAQSPASGAPAGWALALAALALWRRRRIAASVVG